MSHSKSLILLIAISAFLAVFLPLLMGNPWIGHDGMMGMMGYGWWFAAPISFFALIAAGAYFHVTELAGTNRPYSGNGRRTSDMLNEGIAKGEISRERYLKMKQDLGAL